jgi:thiamine biosynthesis protein ThiI
MQADSMHVLVKVFSEIFIKSMPVRKRMIRQLRDNLRKLLADQGVGIDVRQDWEKIEIIAPAADAAITAQVADVLARTPGIANFSLIQAYPLGDLDNILEKVVLHWGEALHGKTFCVRVKRHGNHSFSSMDVERYIGGGLLLKTQAKGVDLHQPDFVVPLEIKKDRLFIITRKTQGLGGYPLGTQDAVLSLISGGFDSTVSTYQCIKRGLRAHYCFFNLGGRAHELGVKEVAYYLWSKYGASHRVKFVTVPFEDVVQEILTKVDNAYMGVVLKRMMLRAAEQVAASLEIPALVTGESVAQVSSQTLINLSVIDQVTDMLVLRPLVTMDKGDIIDISRRIGTETFAASMPEYCGVISVNPTTRARQHKVEEVETHFDFDILERAITTRVAQNIDDVVGELDADLSVPLFAELQAGQVVIDIRHPDEEELAPLALPAAVELRKIPFYALNKQFPGLQAESQYLLYCEKGVMSQLHAAHLKSAGHTNVGVYRPVKASSSKASSKKASSNNG